LSPERSTKATRIAKETTPGRQDGPTNKARQRLHAEITKAQKSKITVSLNGKIFDCDFSTMLDSVEESTPCPEEVYIRLRLEHPDKKSHAPTVEWEMLNQGGEKQKSFQEHLKGNLYGVESAYVLDTQNHGSDTPSFMPPSTEKRVNGKSAKAVYMRDAMFDAMSSVAGLGLEMKGKETTSADMLSQDFAVLAQALGRVRVVRAVAGHVGRYVLLAVGPTSAWALVLTRHNHIGPSDSPDEKIDILRVNSKDVNEIWSAVTDAELQHPGWSLTRDGRMLACALADMQLPIFFCLVKHRSCRVYDITLPQYYEDAQGTKLGVCSVDAPDFVIKLTETEGHKREVCALKLLLPDYALGHVELQERGAGTIPDRLRNRQQFVESLEQGFRSLIVPEEKESDFVGKESLWWLKAPPLSDDTTGGALIMRQGEKMEAFTASTAPDIFQDLSRCLHAAHEKGLVHCDIRWCNVLRFQGCCQLIDWDRSRKVGEMLVLSPGSNQWKAAGPRARSTRGPIAWSICHDHDMLTRFFISAHCPSLLLPAS
jgi:hypothetical protein